jgi:hypothetical protein
MPRHSATCCAQEHAERVRALEDDRRALLKQQADSGAAQRTLEQRLGEAEALVEQHALEQQAAAESRHAAEEAVARERAQAAAQLEALEVRELLCVSAGAHHVCVLYACAVCVGACRHRRPRHGGD